MFSANVLPWPQLLLTLPLFIDGEVILSSEGITQGDPLAMAIYAIGILPLIHHLNHQLCTQVWYADDAAVGGSLSALREWWDDLCSSGPMFGYYPNASKSWLVLKDESAALDSSNFGDTDINLTTEGHRYLGSVIGSSNFVACFVEKKVSDWVDQIIKLKSIALSQPHAAFSAFTHGLSSKWTYFLRTVPNVKNYFQPLEDTI